jgi:hypothetical protein
MGMAAGWIATKVNHICRAKGGGNLGGTMDLVSLQQEGIRMRNFAFVIQVHGSG